MDIKNMFSTKMFRGALIGTGIAIAILAIFRAGMFLGFHKAGFSYQWAENYHRNFDGPRREGGFIENIEQRLGGGRTFMGGHGTLGTILKIDTNALVVKNQDNTENIAVLSGDTVVRAGAETLHASDLKVDDQIVIIGSPDEQGEIQAKFIRIFR